ncbi:MAG: cryptochrome/photolyase family protein, partial [Alphaproteobacteria bacterium]
MRTLRLVLGDQLSRTVASLRDIDPKRDVVLMAEVEAEATYVRHHKQKIVLVLAAMRAFAKALRADGLPVDYVCLDDAGNNGSIVGEIARAADRHRPDRILLTSPGEHRLLSALEAFAETSEIPVEILDDDRFFVSPPAFARWAKGRKTLRMEHFYRHMRRETGILMDGDEPTGGAWNFDAANREPLPAEHTPTAPLRFEPDGAAEQVIAMVSDRFGGHFGELDGFGWAVTRPQALEALDSFVRERLPTFGDYQDGMSARDPFAFHSLLSPYLNIGLLDPREVCERVEAAYRAGDVPINSAEGFIRQILGWREFVRGVYWLEMPDYEKRNALAANRPLPAFFWTGATRMNCIADAVKTASKHAYGHHIQRLMVTGNFALLAGLAPAEVAEWYLIVYADAFEWVEHPNTLGMALFADGGVLASKPYAASGAYLDRMSDYCAGCAYSPRKKLGPGACPFNYLYWAFLMRNRKALEDNPR